MKIDKPEDYYDASLERMKQAWTLYHEENGNSYALAMYVAGVAVECMLRAFKMLKDTTFDEKHDLRRMFEASGMLASEPVLKDKGLSEERAIEHFRRMQTAISEICRLWVNGYRFTSEKRLKAYLKHIQFDRGVKGDYLKAAALRLLESSQDFINRGIFQWSLSRKPDRS